MSNSSDPLKFDVRTIERNIKYEKLTRKEVHEHLESLPDVSKKAITLGEIEDARVTDRGEGDSRPERPTPTVAPAE